MFFYKITLRNGMIYNVQDKEYNIAKFMGTIFKAKWRDFLLADTKKYNKNGEDIDINTVMILTTEIIAVEYSLNLQEVLHNERI